MNDVGLPSFLPSCLPETIFTGGLVSEEINIWSSSYVVDEYRVYRYTEKDPCGMMWDICGTFQRMNNLEKILLFLPLLLTSDSIKKQTLVHELKQSVFYYPAGFF